MYELMKLSHKNMKYKLYDCKVYNIHNISKRIYKSFKLLSSSYTNHIFDKILYDLSINKRTVDYTKFNYIMWSNRLKNIPMNQLSSNRGYYRRYFYKGKI